MEDVSNRNALYGDGIRGSRCKIIPTKWWLTIHVHFDLLMRDADYWPRFPRSMESYSAKISISTTQVLETGSAYENRVVDIDMTAA